MSGKALTAAVGGDPRRPDDAQRPPKPVQEDEIDIMLVISMMVGLGGFMLKHTLMAWVALLVAIVGIANLKSTAGMQHVVSAAVFSVVGLIGCYTHQGPRGYAAIFPPKPAAA